MCGVLAKSQQLNVGEKMSSKKYIMINFTRVKKKNEEFEISEQRTSSSNHGGLKPY
jgi:hypothetical protein